MGEINYIFIGGTYRGFKLLEHLIRKGFKPAMAFILKEDAHEKLVYSKDIMDICEQNEVEYFLRKKLLREDEEEIKKAQYAFGIVCGWRTIINEQLSANFEHGLIAAHDSLLPLYRGFAPLNWAIINGEKKTGVTLFVINEGEVDSGPVLGQREVEIDPNEYAIDLYERITVATIELYEKLILDYKNKSIKAIAQDESAATYTCKRLPTDGKIDWTKSSSDVFNLVRGLAHPYPGSFFSLLGKEYVVRKASFGNNNHKKYAGNIAGRVIGIPSEGVEVLCGEGTILITEVEDKETGEVFNLNTLVKSINTTLN